MWWWRWNWEWSNVNGSERWDMIGDLDGIWSIDGIESNGVKALRMGGTSGEMVLMAVRW